MSEVPQEPGGTPSRAGSLREAVALIAAAVVTRGELASLELSEARERAAQWIALALLSAVLLVAALVVGSLWFVSIFWDTHRSGAIAVAALVYAIAGGGLMAWLVARLRAAPPLLQATLNELKQDTDALRGLAGRQE